MATQKVKHMKRVGHHAIQAVYPLNTKRNGEGDHAPANPANLGTRVPSTRTPQFGRRTRRAAVITLSATPAQRASPGMFEGVVIRVKKPRTAARIAAIELARQVVAQAIAEYHAAKEVIVGGALRGAH